MGMATSVYLSSVQSFGKLIQNKELEVNMLLLFTLVPLPQQPEPWTSDQISLEFCLGIIIRILTNSLSLDVVPEGRTLLRIYSAAEAVSDKVQ